MSSLLPDGLNQSPLNWRWLDRTHLGVLLQSMQRPLLRMLDEWRVKRRLLVQLVMPHHLRLHPLRPHHLRLHPLLVLEVGHGDLKARI